MTQGTAGSVGDLEAPSPGRVKSIVRKGLNLSESTPINVSEDGEFSNINYVYRVEVPGRRLYLKVVPERPKRLPVRLPRERVFSEAEGLRRFRALVGDTIIIPEVLFIDAEDMALAMSDVGEDREILFRILPERFGLLGEQAGALGRALGAIHGGTRGLGTPRPPLEEATIRKIIFDGLLGPGARLVFPSSWDSVNTEMQANLQCLIHGDLWSKNLLVRAGEPVAVVDFEGVCCGDPAFDLGTLMAVALVPALDNPALLNEALDFSARLLAAWASNCGFKSWPGEVFRRTFRAVAPFLAARCSGPFAYSLSESGRQRIGLLARSLAERPPSDLEAFGVRVLECAAQSGLGNSASGATS